MRSSKFSQLPFHTPDAVMWHQGFCLITGRSLTETGSAVSNVSNRLESWGGKKKKKKKEKKKENHLMAPILRPAHTFSHLTHNTLRIEGHLFDE